MTARIEGRSSKPTITLSDDRLVWDQPRILRELTLGTVVRPTAQLSDPLDNYVTRALNRTLSAEMSRLFQGYVDEWALERERGGLFTGTGALVATVGVPLGRNLSLRHRGRLISRIIMNQLKAMDIKARLPYWAKRLSRAQSSQRTKPAER